MTNVASQRAEYTAKLPSWAMIRAAIAGEEKVKAAGVTFLPKPNPSDASVENDERYQQYLARAVYYNATGRTSAALAGIAFNKWPEVELPKDLEYLLSDADGSGVGIINQSQVVTSNVIDVGRAGLLVDYPPTEAPASRAAQVDGGIRANVQLYPAETIINWRVTRRGALNLLSLVVLTEKAEAWNGFEQTLSDQWRVLRLGTLNADDAGPERYIVELWRKGANGADDYVMESQYVPLDGSGQPWEIIPFAFIGATNNDPTPDAAPLYDISVMNLAHYRNSADYEESVFFVGQPQIWVSGADEAWVALMKKEGIYFGSRAIGATPVNGSVTMLQASPNTLAGEAMKAKEAQMAGLGARLIAPGEAAKTATQAGGEERVAHSVLSLICDNVSDAYRKALQWVARFMRVTGETDFSLSTEFGGIQFDAQQVAAALALVQGGKLPEADLWNYLRSVGLIEATKSDEDVRGELEAEAGGVDLAGPTGAPPTE